MLIQNDKIQIVPPSQDQLDAAEDMYHKFMLLSPEKYIVLCERELSILFAKITKPTCCFNTSHKHWMYYNGRYWELDPSGVRIRQVMNRFAFELLRYATDITSSVDDPFLKIAQSLGDASKRNSLIKDSIDKSFISDEELDADIYLINLQNGTFDLRKMKLREHSYKDHITKMANVEFSPTAQSSLLDNVMNSIFSDNQELIEYVYRVFGLSLSGETSPECFWIGLGETTRNGKSTIMNTFCYMLGGSKGYGMNCDISSLAKKKYYNGSGPSSDIARLRAARFVIASEPPKDFQFDEAKVKQLTGGDTITARMLRSNDIEYTARFKIMIATNHRPTFSDDSVLNSGRLRVIPFKRHFEESEQDKGLKEKMKDPLVLSALFLKCLKGWVQYKKNGLNEPSIMTEALSEFKTSSQVFSLFLESVFDPAPDNMIALSEFYPQYESWCSENGFVIMGKAKVNEMMRSKGVYKSSGTINGLTHRNLLVGYKQKKKGRCEDVPQASNIQANSKRYYFSDFLIDEPAEKQVKMPWDHYGEKELQTDNQFEDPSPW